MILNLIYSEFFFLFMSIKKYRVHRLEIKGAYIKNKLKQFLNNLEGEVVSIIPNIKKTVYLKFME